MLAESTRYIADDADRNRAQLRVFVRFERGIQVRQECLDVRRESMLESCDRACLACCQTFHNALERTGCQGSYHKESILQKGRCLAGDLDELQDKRHNSVGQWLNAIVELANNALERTVNTITWLKRLHSSSR